MRDAYTAFTGMTRVNVAWLVCVFQRYYRGASRQQWLTDLLYYYSVTVAHSSSSRQGNLGLRDMFWSPWRAHLVTLNHSVESTAERFLSEVNKCIKYFPLKRCCDLLPTEVSVVIMMLHWCFIFHLLLVCHGGLFLCFYHSGNWWLLN